jgi:hypothetical protein
MPTLCYKGVATSEVDNGSTKIRISHSKVLEAFGGKSFHWDGGDDGSESEDEVSALSFGVKLVPHVEAGSTFTSVSTLTPVSCSTGSGRNFPRRAKEKEVVVLDSGTFVTDNVLEVPQDVIPTASKEKVPKKSRTTKATKSPTPTRSKRTSKFSKTVPSPTRRLKITAGPPTAHHVLPDGTLNVWSVFLDGGGYAVTGEEKDRVKMFVKEKHRNTAFVSEAVKFHVLVREMRKNLDVDSARDCWTKVLPLKSSDNFNFCCLFLMVATPNTPDEKMIEVFSPIMKDNYVTPECTTN